MKYINLSFIIAILGIVVATSCSDDNVESSTPSAVDTKTWTLDANIDSSVKPGDNFFMYCNGTWWKNTEIPAGMSRYGTATDMENQIEKIQQTISDPRINKLNDDFLDAEKDTANAVAVIREKYLEVCNLSSKQEVWEAYAKLMGEGYILDGYSLQIKPDNGIMLVAIKDTKLKSTTEEWKQYALKRIGVAQTEKADAFMDSAQGYDALGAFLKTIGVSADYFDSGDASLVTNIYESNSAEDLKDIVETTILDDVAVVSNNDVSAYYSYEHNIDKPSYFTSYNNYIRSYAYANACLSEDLKNEYRIICEQMRSSFRKRIESLDWMSSTTKQNAIEKLNAMKFNIGGPEKWREEALPSLDDCQSYVEDVMRLRKSYADLYCALAGTDVQDACLE